jgi:alpha-beta hydrolase superfamily lysophospholipase
MEAIAEAVNNLVPSKRAFVMGGSMGGYIAMTFGARHLDMCRYHHLPTRTCYHMALTHAHDTHDTRYLRHMV